MQHQRPSDFLPRVHIVCFFNILESDNKFAVEIGYSTLLQHCEVARWHYAC